MTSLPDKSLNDYTPIELAQYALSRRKAEEYYGEPPSETTKEILYKVITILGVKIPNGIHIPKNPRKMGDEDAILLTQIISSEVLKDFIDGLKPTPRTRNKLVNIKTSETNNTPIEKLKIIIQSIENDMVAMKGLYIHPEERSEHMRLKEMLSISKELLEQKEVMLMVANRAKQIYEKSKNEVK